MLTLIAVNILIFFACEYLGGSEDLELMHRLGVLYVPDLQNGEYWRLFTAMFLHYGFAHLMSNMVSLFAFGGYMEHAIGHVRFLLLYMLGGLAGSLACWFWDVQTGEYVFSAGASGAVFALMGGMLTLVILRRELTRGVSVPRMLLAVVLSLYPAFYMEDISLAAHVGGLIGGLVIMGALLPTIRSGGGKRW
ncbi:MAG: rhomboid family intramembrane serine protease [Eubacteriales bacterium]|nr:rhomboid family intramembrane serine protease [Eubacteriales bacterium]